MQRVIFIHQQFVVSLYDRIYLAILPVPNFPDLRLPDDALLALHGLAVFFLHVCDVRQRYVVVFLAELLNDFLTG